MTMGIRVSRIYGGSHHFHHGNVGLFQIARVFSKFSLLIGYQSGHFIKVTGQLPQLILRVDFQGLFGRSILQFFYTR